MKTYRLHVSMPSSKFGVDVVCDTYHIYNNRIMFMNNKENSNETVIIADYPSNYTIIEKITDNE